MLKLVFVTLFANIKSIVSCNFFCGQSVSMICCCWDCNADQFIFHIKRSELFNRSPIDCNFNC